MKKALRKSHADGTTVPEGPAGAGFAPADPPHSDAVWEDTDAKASRFAASMRASMSFSEMEYISEGAVRQPRITFADALGEKELI